MRAAALLLCAVLAACAAPAPEVPQRLAVVTDPLPAMKLFGPPQVTPPARSNAALARDYMELAFQMESGRSLEWLTRFDGPITIAMTGPVPPTAPADLARVVARFRTEAGLDVVAVPKGPAAILIEFLPRAKLQSLVPLAACFVVPNVAGWAEYRAARRSARVDWTALEQRTRVTIFVPSDTSPQEVRDCLHEELAQAIGPLNDLYRLSDSVFNDDNFHTVLTGFDMLMLRVHYAPEFANGMPVAEVAAALPGVLARLNPRGGTGSIAQPDPTPRDWISAVETALGPRVPDGERRGAAQKALAIARTQGWRDARLAFSYFAVGRLSLASEVETAVTSLAEAARIYRGLPDARIHVAHIDMQMAAFALSAGQAEQTLLLTGRAIPVVQAAENAALLSTLLMIRAEALSLQGRDAEARAVRLDSLGWARYGFGSEDQVRARLSEIAILSPRTGRG